MFATVDSIGGWVGVNSCHTIANCWTELINNSLLCTTSAHGWNGQLSIDPHEPPHFKDIQYTGWLFSCLKTIKQCRSDTKSTFHVLHSSLSAIFMPTSHIQTHWFIHNISNPLTDLSAPPHVHAPPSREGDETCLYNCLWMGEQLTSGTFPSIQTLIAGEIVSLPTVPNTSQTQWKWRMYNNKQRVYTSVWEAFTM